MAQSRKKIIIGVILSVMIVSFPSYEKYFRQAFDSIDDVSRAVEKEVTSQVVERVVDGDTLVLEGGEKVRLIGVDAPESVKPGSKTECFGKESSEYLKQKLEGKIITLQKDTTDRDRYDRHLRYINVDQEFINELLVSEGYARAKSYPPDRREEERLWQAEQRAKEKGLGLWGKCSSP